MKQKEKFSFKGRIKSFKYAGNGAKHLFLNEHNFRIHIGATILAVILGILLSISPTEWCIVVLCIGSVLCAEGLNTAIEIICDRVNPEYDEAIKKAKDISAASVTFVALVALIVGIIIFLPKLLSLSS